MPHDRNARLFIKKRTRDSCENAEAISGANANLPG
jgi:hypothetical protein